MIDMLEMLATDYNQYSSDSLLWQDIQYVLHCSESQAKTYAKSHCNSVSFWMCLFASDLIECVPYYEYFETGLDNDLITEKGYIIDKEKLCRKLGVDFEIKFTTDFEAVSHGKDLEENKIYQIRIKSRAGGKHFMACMLDDVGLLKLFDTSNRGVNVPAVKFINRDNFEKIMEV